MTRRQAEEKFFLWSMYASTSLILLVLGVILATVLAKGWSSLSFSMIFQVPKGDYFLGHEGGILNAILGSLYMIGGATLLAFLLALPVVLYMNVFARPGTRMVAWARVSFDVLASVPSIVYGAIGFILMMLLGMRTSLLAGQITVALLILPIMIRGMDEVFRQVPGELIEASFALGANRLETSLKVVLRQCMPGVLTAVLLSIGRGMGDAASVLFTAGFTNRVPGSLTEPAATLPLAIFFQLGSPVPQVQKRAYAAALVLTLIILAISLAARWLSRRFSRHIIR